MDLTMIYILIIVSSVVILTFVVNKLRTKNIISNEDLLIVSQIFSLSLSLIDELNLKNESKILQISNIVLGALDYANNLFISPEMVAEKALEKCYELCKELNITVTESRRLIIIQLINIALSNKHGVNMMFLEV